jgi:putative ABC transport system permease protein
VESWLQDLRYAIRSLRSAPRFVAIVIATLALGIGANSAVFGVLNAVVLQPLPYPQPDRLVRVYQHSNNEDGFLGGMAFLDFRESSKTLDMAAVYTYRAEGLDLTDRPQPERVQVYRVSADYFRVLGIALLAGQPFERADERPNANVAVVSERLWREYLGGASTGPALSAVEGSGRMLSLNGVPTRVVGIMPRSFTDPLLPDIEIWTPLNLQPGGPNSWQNNYLTSMARLRPGATLQSAQAELQAIAARHQSNYGANSRLRSARIVPLQSDTVGTAGPMLWLLFGGVGLLLLIACVNVAGLMLARSAARESELGIRAALGSSQWRLVRQVIVESVLLSLAGGVIGLAFAQLVTRVLMVAAPESVARVASTGASAWVFIFGLLVAVIAGLAFSLAPAFQFTRPGIERVLRDSSRGASASHRQTRFRSILVVCQVALALVLLIGAGLLLRSFERLSTQNLGIAPGNIITFEVHLPGVRYAEPAARATFHAEFQRRLAALPGVRASGAVSYLPVSGRYHSWGFRRTNQGAQNAQADQRVVEGEYFRAMGIPVLRGRVFGSQDNVNPPRQVVISQATARAVFGDEDPIGQTLRIIGDTVEIIGVVGDVASSARGAIVPIIYHSHRQFAGDRNWALIQVVALDRPLPALLTDVRRELASIDPALVLYQPRMLTDIIGNGIAQDRFALMVIGAYAVVALSLAAVGIYGVLSYAVSRRRRELGIRIALGAQRGWVRGMVVRDGARLALIGVGLGLAGALLATRALGSMLFGVSATEPLVFAAASALLLLVALAASWIPARSATNVDPLHALRSDA